MNIPFAVAAVALAALSLFTSHARADETPGVVQGIYFESAPGVLSSKPMLGGRPDARRWADVELSVPGAGEPKRVLVEIPRDIAPRVGDRVGLELGGGPKLALTRRDNAPVERVGRITTVKPAILAGVRG